MLRSGKSFREETNTTADAENEAGTSRGDSSKVQKETTTTANTDNEPGPSRKNSPRKSKVQIVATTTDDEPGSSSRGKIEFYPALLNDVVLRKIFSSLEYASLKKCRAVCQKWKSIIEPTFRNKTIAFFHEGARESDIAVLKRLFSNTEIPITGLELRGAIPWKLTQMQSFFRNQGSTITSLKLIEQFSLLAGNGKPCPEMDMGPLLTENLKVFTYQAMDFLPGFDSKQTLIPAESLQSLDSVSVTGGTIVLSGHRIKPKELRLSYNKFMSHDHEVHSMDLAEFVNFDRLEILDLQPPYMQSVVIIVDLEGARSLKILTLYNKMVLRHWDVSRWKISRLTLHSTPFTQRTQMNISELILYNTRADISLLPPTLKKLVLRTCRDIICSFPVTFFHLESLKFESNDTLEFLQYFSSCPSVVELLISGYFEPTPLNVDYIPKSVRRIFLSHLNDFVGESIFEFETLVVTNVTMEPKFLNQYGLPASKLKPKNLTFIINPVKILDKRSKANFNSHFRRIIRFPKTNFDNVVFGAFDWATEETFGVSYLSEYVDKIGRYFLFEKGQNQGTAIGLQKIHDIVFGNEKSFELCKESYWFYFERSVELF